MSGRDSSEARADKQTIVEAVRFLKRLGFIEAADCVNVAAWEWACTEPAPLDTERCEVTGCEAGSTIEAVVAWMDRCIEYQAKTVRHDWDRAKLEAAEDVRADLVSGAWRGKEQRRESPTASPFTIREEQPGTFRVYVYSCGLYPTGTREDAERLLRSLEYERAQTNKAVTTEFEELRALLARAVELFGAPTQVRGGAKGNDHG